MATFDHERGNTTGGNSMKNYQQQGQTLLILVLLSTILATIGLSIAQSTIQDNQIAQLEEQTKRAFSAAEAGIEATLKRGVDVVEGDLTFPGIKSLTALFVTTSSSDYITPILENNRQFTFYLSSFNQTDSSFGSPLSSSQLIKINPTDLNLQTMCSSQTTAFAVELTFVNTENSTLFRRLIDHCDLLDDTVDEWSFNTSTQIGDDANLLVMRIVGAGATFNGARLTISNPSAQWSAQGRSIVSTATTTTGVVRKIRLFSSYPQMPASLFVPSF